MKMQSNTQNTYINDGFHNEHHNEKQEEQFHRLSPFSIFMKLIESLPQLAIPIYFAYNGDWENMIVLSMIAFFGFFTLISMLLNHYYFTYQFQEDEIIIRSGVLRKKQRNIPLKRIQNTNLTQNFLHRIFSIYKLEFETAGDSSSEGVLNGISKKHFDEIEVRIKQFRASELNSSKQKLDNTENTDDIENKEEKKLESHILFHLDFNQLLKYGMMRFRPLLLPVIGYLYATFRTYNPSIDENLIYWFESNYGDLYASINYFQIALSVILLIIGAFIFSWLLDILLTMMQYYKFTLSNEGEHLKTVRGLINKRSATIPLKKLQMLSFYTNFIRRKFNYYGLALETAGFGGKNKGPEVAVPFFQMQKVVELAQNIIKFDFPFEFLSVSKKTIRRSMFRYSIKFVIMLIVLAMINYYLLFIFVLYPLLYWFALKNYDYRKYAIQEDKVIIKRGYIFEKISIVPISKIQTVLIRQTFFQRRLGIASLIIDTAASPKLNETVIMDIDYELAQELMKQVMDKFNKTNK